MLGILEWERGGYAEALEHYEAALALVRAIGADRGDEAVILNSLGVTLTKLGRPDEARTVLEESLALSREIGERQLEAHALAALGQVSLNAHDLDGAAECFEQSRALRQASAIASAKAGCSSGSPRSRPDWRSRPPLDASEAAAAAAAERATTTLDAACADASRGHVRLQEISDAPLHHRT